MHRTDPAISPAARTLPGASAVGALRLPRLHREVVALGWLPAAPGDSGMQLVLPLDLFLLTLQADDGDGEFDLRVSLLRARPLPFRSRRRGMLAFALLTPAGLLGLLRTPLRGLGERVPLSTLCGAPAVAALRDGLRHLRDPLQRTLCFGRWIESRLSSSGSTDATARVADAAAWLQRQRGGFDRALLADTLAVSTRQLERDFRHWLGVSPAAYARLVRFQCAARAVVDGAALADTAHAHHFCDQAHLNRGFRELSSLAPRAFARLARMPRRRAEQQALAGRVFLLDAPAGHRPLG